MTGHKFRLNTATILSFATAILTVTTVSVNAAASEYKVLYTFKATEEGAAPRGNLVMDASGNLYGTTGAGGTGFGNVFKLTPHPDGSWTEVVLHSFSGPDGKAPLAGVTLDAAGNLYGTTSYGGTFCPSQGGCGVVFKLTPNPSGPWTEAVLWDFQGPHSPEGGVVFDKAGNLYGTTSYGGDPSCDPPSGCGVVFKLTPHPGGAWTYTPIHKFTGSPDGRNPMGELGFDAAGNLYGTTLYGGLDNSASAGTFYRLTPSTDGTWTETVLHAFTGLGDGAYPMAGVSVDNGNILPLTTAYGGDINCLEGKLTLGCGTAAGHAFTGPDGAVPLGTLTADAEGNLYGTTTSGGNLDCSSPFGCGVAFKLSDGKLTILHTFDACAENPVAGLIIDAAGNLYGTVEQGMGAYDLGLVFEITP